MPKKTRSPSYLYKLAGKIKEKYDNQANFAYALKTSPAVVSYRLSRTRNFPSSEIPKWCDLLEIRSDEIRDYFFPDWKPKADRIVPSGKARARYDPATGSILCPAYAGGERRE